MGVAFQLPLPFAQVQGEIVRQPLEMAEILLDHDPLIPEAQDEIPDPVMGVEFHDVPEDRHAADLDHRLRPRLGLLGDACAAAAGEDDRLHTATTLATAS